MASRKKKEEEEEAELTSGLALAQAANTLILATSKAEHNNDVAALMKIAGGWMEIHEYLSGDHHGEDKKQPLGFVGSKVEHEEEVEELDDAIAAEGRSRTGFGFSGLYKEHGQFRVPKGGYRN